MNRFFAIFYVANRSYQYRLEDVLDACSDGMVDSSFIPIAKKLLFPIDCTNETYWIRSGSNGWKVLCNAKEVTQPQQVRHGDYLEIYRENISYDLLLVSVSRVSLSNRRIALEKNRNLFIGRAQESNIVVDISGYTSSKHAAIRVDGEGRIFLEDLARKKGVYVNGRRQVSCELHCGDQVQIMGQTLVCMNGFLLVPAVLQVNGLTPCQQLPMAAVPVEIQEEEAYVRTPRILKSLDKGEVVIDAPTPPQKMKQQPFLLTAGPSATMAIAMLASLGVTIYNSLNNGSYASIVTSAVMAFSMLLGALMWPGLQRRYQKKQAQANEAWRVSRYDAYLQEREKEIETKYRRNIRIWNENLFPSPEHLMQYAQERNRCLWDRMPQDKDFLSIRLGLGEHAFETTIKCPPKGFVLEEDSMIDKALALGEKYSRMQGIPMVISLKEKRVVGVVGQRDKIMETLRCMILGICVQHAYDEVKMVLVCNREQSREVEYAFELPHIWSADHTVRYLAQTKEEVQELFGRIDESLRERETLLEEGAPRIPHYVFFILDRRLTEDAPLMRILLQADNQVGVSACFVEEKFASIPKECTAIIQNDQDVCGIYVKNENDNRFLQFHADSFPLSQMEACTSQISRIPVRTERAQLSVPERVTFLNMCRVGNIDALKIADRWDNNNSNQTLAAPIGIRAGGEAFCLDIHEKHHGCHGLVAGMTGSGKSEFLQAYILSMLINYSPNEVAFVLVDFKGGDMARPFLKSPHLAATISNLSSNILYRAYVSLQAEVKSRQRIFNEAAEQLGIDKIDINSYHKYFKEKKLTKPLPHLIIVIDEFAQLKQQHMEFMSRLIDIAQVGRSLGIHLILATQKPSGVVDPQIWSNSRFRVCLKVLGKEDSNEMIGRQDAALIKLPGRAYVQVGYDEVFEQIQSGYSGAAYTPMDRFVDEEAVTVKMVDSTASALRIARDIPKSGGKSERTQLEETVLEINRIAKARGVHAAPLWLPMLKETMSLEQCDGNFQPFEKAEWDKQPGYETICGMMDLPESQQQIPYVIDFIRDGHLAVYGTGGSGKTQFLQTILYAMARKYSPERLQVFLLDFGGRALQTTMAAMPHCVNAACGDEEEKVVYILGQLQAIVEERKELFSQNRCSSFESYLQMGNTLPMVLVVLDNYSAFREKMYKQEDEILRLASSAKSYGIFLVITGNSKNAIYYKVAEHITNRVAFRMTDKLNYRDVLNNVPVPIELENIKGRALTVYQKKAVEVQIALPVICENENGRVEWLGAEFKKMREAWGGKALSIPEIQEKQMPSAVPSNAVQKAVPQKAAPQAVLPVPKLPEHSLIVGKSLLSGQPQGFELMAMQNVFVGNPFGYGLPPVMVRSINALPNHVCYVFDSAGYDSSTALEKEILAANAEDISNMIVLLEKAVAERSQETAVLKEMGLFKEEIYGNMQQYPRVFVVIQGFCDFYDTISDEDLEKLERLLRKTENTCIYFIVTDDMKRITDYCGTELYIRLVKSNAGLIMGGNISDQMAAILQNDFRDIPVPVRQKPLKQSQALLYIGKACSTVEAES